METKARLWKQLQVIGYLVGFAFVIFSFLSTWWNLVPAALSMGLSIFAYSKGYAEKRLITKVDSAIVLVQTATFVRLRNKYDKHRHQDLIAGAVLNELFSYESPTENGRQFAKKNAKLIRQKITELKDDTRLCTVITQTLRVKAAIEVGLKLQPQEEAMRPLERLSESGILIPGVDSPRLDTFLQLVQDYCREHGIE
jgi:hypothetical protein